MTDILRCFRISKADGTGVTIEHYFLYCSNMKNAIKSPKTKHLNIVQFYKNPKIEHCFKRKNKNTDKQIIRK